MLNQAGYKIMHFRKHGFPRSETLDLYLTVLARPEIEPDEHIAITPERNVALKRALGTLKRNTLTKLMPNKTWLPLEDNA